MQRTKTAKRTAGSALAHATIMVLALAAILTAIFRITTAEYVRSRQWRDETRSFYIAEAGMNEALGTLIVEGKAALLALSYPRTMGSGTYSVDVVLGEDDPILLDWRIRLSAFGAEGRARSGIQVVAWAIPNGEYTFAAFGEDGVLLNSNAYIDSYDSNDGPYPGLEPSGYFGNVGSNEDIELDANAQIYGDTVPGPDGVLIDSDPNTYVFGATSSADEDVVLDPVIVPVVPPTGFMVVAGTQTLGPGSVHKTAISVKAGGLLKLVGPAVVVIDDLELLSNSNLVVDATAGPVEIYGTGDFELKSNSSVTTLADQAKDISVFLTADTDASPAKVVSLNSNSQFTGTIYAPEADLTLKSNFNLFGAVVGESVTLASNSALHFDEDLMYLDGIEPEYAQLSWRVLSEQEE